MNIPLLFSFMFTVNSFCADMPIEQKKALSQNSYPWLTENRFRVVLQCQDFRYSSEHQISWAELDLASMQDALLNIPWNPESVRVIEYDVATKQPIIRFENESGLKAFFVPAKVDKWLRKKGNAKVERSPHVSWLRRSGDASDAIYICYFDAVGYGEQESIVEPGYIGTGDALSYGTAGIMDSIRGTPLVFDYDNDGKKDILGALGTVPEKVTYFYKNISTSSNFVFSKPMPISLEKYIKGCRQIDDVDDDGKIDAIGYRGGYYSDVCNKGFSSWINISAPLESEVGKIIQASCSANWYNLLGCL